MKKILATILLVIGLVIASCHRLPVPKAAEGCELGQGIELGVKCRARLELGEGGAGICDKEISSWEERCQQ